MAWCDSGVAQKHLSALIFHLIPKFREVENAN